MTSDELRQAIVRLCREYGYPAEYTYDLIDNVIDSIDVLGTDSAQQEA